MKWICASVLTLLMHTTSQGQQDTINLEDAYQGIASDENALSNWEDSNIDVNNLRQVAHLPIAFQNAIAAYKEENGCIAHLRELYRISTISPLQWDSIMPWLTCAPCAQKPKFIRQNLTLTAKDISRQEDNLFVVSKYNIRYRAKSENGYQWGLHHFAQSSGLPSHMSTGYFQLQKKKQHWIIGDFLPQTPQHLLFANNLMSSSPWMVMPMVANAQRFVPYTSSIPNRHWRGMAYAFAIKKLTLSAAMDLDSIQASSIPKIMQRWGSAEWRSERIKMQYHWYLSESEQKQQHAINLAFHFKDQMLQTEWEGKKGDWKWDAYWVKPLSKNQMLRLEHRVEWNAEQLFQTNAYLHQVVWNKKFKMLLSVDQKTSYRLWLSNSTSEQNFRLQLDFSPQRYHVFYLRYQMHQDEQIMQQWRIDGQWATSENGKFHCRIEQHVQNKNSGWLSALEYDWKPLGKAWHLIARQTFYAVPEWDLRIYMMDRELKGGMSIPAYSGRGKKTFFILQYQNPMIRLALKWTLLFPQTYEVNSGLTTLDLQIALTF